MTTAVLPPLREELTLHNGPAASDGSPTWNLQDPIRNRFFRIDWSTFLILSHWHLGKPDAICAAVQDETPVEITPSDVETVVTFLAQSELLQCSDPRATRRLLAANQLARQSFWTWLLHHYLFFRIPLFRPDAWLTRLTPHVEIFYSRNFLRLTLLALAIGLFETFRQWPHFKATFVDTLSWERLTAYAGVLIAIKALHELGHAFTAKRYGCRVPAMGVAFLVMWPVAYTDVNETWKLPSRKQRLAVGAAGVLTELAVAAWATFAWAFLPDGALRGFAFLLAAVTWISTLAINASPFMRFDGYFLLSDWLDIPNLHSRAFALARWRLREFLFGLREEKPEYFSAARERLLIVFAVLTWLYRLALFIGIAVLVYRHVFKALGLVLFIVEIAWFVALPVGQELKEWAKRWPAIRGSRRARSRAGLGLALAALLVLPLDVRVGTQAMLRPTRSIEIYAPDASIVTIAPALHGARIAAGQPLVKLFSPDIERRLALAQSHRARIVAQLRASNLDVSLQADLPVLREQLAALDSELAGLAQENARLEPAAPFAGIVVDTLPDLHAGDTVSRHARLATLIDRSSWDVKAYLEERDVARVSVGDKARFYPETPGALPLDLTVQSIDRDASRTLPEAALGSIHGGEIPVRASGETQIPERAIYGIVLRVDKPETLRAIQQLRGQVTIRAKPQTVLADYTEAAASVLIRESGW
jgi:putative peptide zinc metalloprotease protein